MSPSIIPKPDSSRFAALDPADLVLAYLAGQKTALSAKLLARRLAAVADAATVAAGTATLCDRGLVSANAQVVLHEAGRAAGKTLLGRDAGSRWEDVLTRRLFPLSLGLDPEAAELRTRLARPDARQAAVIAIAYGLPAEMVGRKVQVCSELVWRTLEAGLGALLGQGRLPEITKPGVTERVLLAGLAGGTAKSMPEAVKLVAFAALGRPPGDPAALRNGTIALALANARRGPAAATTPPVAQPASPPAKASDGPADGVFAGRVTEVAQALTTPPFQGRVAIAQVYDAYGRAFPDAGSLQSFKERLIAAAFARQLELGRLDMPEYMDKELRQRSEAAWGRDFVHFVITDRR